LWSTGRTPPTTFDTERQLAVNGILSGMASTGVDIVLSNDSRQGALSNGQVFIQKTDGWWQFYPGRRP
jgi:hypothetical protein